MHSGQTDMYLISGFLHADHIRERVGHVCIVCHCANASRLLLGLLSLLMQLLCRQSAGPLHCSTAECNPEICPLT